MVRVKCNIYANVNDCIRKDTCKIYVVEEEQEHQKVKKNNVNYCCTCNKFVPHSTKQYLQHVLRTMRSNVKVRQEQYMTYDFELNDEDINHNYQNHVMKYQNHVNFINEVLHTIRHGQVGYVFNFRQLEDVMSFEPNIIVQLVGKGMFSVRLLKKSMRD